MILGTCQVTIILTNHTIHNNISSGVMFYQEIIHGWGDDIFIGVVTWKGEITCKGALPCKEIITGQRVISREG